MTGSPFTFPFPSRVPVFAAAFTAVLLAAGVVAAGAAPAAPDSEPPLRVAVARFDTIPEACSNASPSGRAPAVRLAEALSDSLAARRVAAVPDTVLAAWLRKLDATRYPDPGDFRRTREYLEATGARRLAYVNEVRVGEDCALAFEVALWSTEPLARRGARHGEAASAAEAAGTLARTLTEWLRAEH